MFFTGNRTGESGANILMLIFLKIEQPRHIWRDSSNERKTSFKIAPPPAFEKGGGRRAHYEPSRLKQPRRFTGNSFENSGEKFNNFGAFTYAE